MENENKRGFTGLWIPVKLIEDKRLSYIDCIMYAEITALDAGNQSEGCFASNKYLSELFGVSEKTISASISKLMKLNYVNLYRFDGRRRFLKSAKI